MWIETAVAVRVCLCEIYCKCVCVCVLQRLEIACFQIDRISHKKRKQNDNKATGRDVFDVNIKL